HPHRSPPTRRSSDLQKDHEAETQPGLLGHRFIRRRGESKSPSRKIAVAVFENGRSPYGTKSCPAAPAAPKHVKPRMCQPRRARRSEEHTSEHQSRFD